MNIKPLNDRIVVKRREKESMSAGGIVLPDSAKDKPMMGEVLAVGPGKHTDKGLRPIDIKVGETVLFKTYAGTEVKHNDEDLLIMKEEDVMGIVE